MRVFILAMLLAFAIAAPAGAADYLIFKAGETRSTDRWVGDEPRPDQMPAGATAVPWTPSAGDNDPHSYELQSGSTVRNPVAIPFVVGQVFPNTKAFKDSVFQDMAISPEVKCELIKFFPLIDMYRDNLLVMQQAWGAMKIAYGGDGTNGKWLTPTLITLLEAKAVAAGMPLIAE